MDDDLWMSQRDRDRLHVIRQVIAHRLSWAQAGEQLGLGWRQVGRLCARVRSQGDRGVRHGLKGRHSNRRLSDESASQILSAVHHPLWEGFGPKFARQKLEAFYGLRVGTETVRRLMVASGLRLVRWRGVRHRAWRERRPSIGMLVQMDGSDHAWFEDRGPRCVLLMLIDDATGLIQHAEFVDSETTLNVMRAVKTYLRRHGRPIAFYVDKDSIYRVAKQKAVQAGIKDEPLTQFKRAMSELDVEVICAHSPQAKGRVERSFKTHQDRLVKELRLAGISSMAAANTFLQRTYIPAHNERYALAPAQPGDAHRPLAADIRLEQVLSVRESRVVQSDFTVQFEKLFLQLRPEKSCRLRAKDRIDVEIRLDGGLHVRHRGRYLRFEQLEKRPHRPYYAHRKQEAWPTKADVERSSAVRKKWLYGWATDRSYIQDTEPLTTTGFV